MKINRMMKLQNQSSDNCEPTDLNEQQGAIGVPFHLSVSQNYRQQTGFTNSIASESISYDQITSLAQFIEATVWEPRSAAKLTCYCTVCLRRLGGGLP